MSDAVGAPAVEGRWRGRFPKNEIISLLDVNRPHNLAESTALDLRLGELLDIVGAADALRALKLGYGPSAGLPALREAAGAMCGVPPEQVLTTQGAALGLFLLAFELCRPGDDVVLAMPCFPPSHDALIGAGVAVREVPLRFDDGYRLDPARVVDALTPATRLVSIASPQNPSGVRVPRETILAVLDAMTRRSPGALLFVDETYRDATYGDEPTPPSAAALDPRIITGASISKAHGAPGLRSGWLTVPDAALRERLTVAKMNIVISVSVLDETLAAALLARRDAVLAPRRRHLAQALDTLARWQAGEAMRLDWVRPQGGALCCLRLRADRFDAAAVVRFWAALPAHDLQLASGTRFGDDDRVFRLGFGYLPLERLAPALAALSRAMDDAAA